MSNDNVRKVKLDIAPLSVNRAYHPVILAVRGMNRGRFSRFSRVTFAKTKQAKRFESFVRESLQEAVPIDGQVSLSVVFTFARSNSDIDNPLKILLDSLQGLLYHKDSQIYQLTVVKNIGQPSICVECRPMVLQ